MIKNSFLLLSHKRIPYLNIFFFTNHKKEEENDINSKKSQINDESFRKYQEICSKEKEKIKQFDQNFSKSEYLNSQMSRFIFAGFAILINIYIFKQIYNVLWKFYFPYKEVETLKIEKK